MHFEGVFDIKAPRRKVWDFVSVPNNIAKCLPDLQKLEVIAPDHFKATVKAGVGFIKGTFNFEFKMFDMQPPTHAKLSAHGSGTGSTIDLETTMDLSDLPDGGTRMTWKADAKVGGLIASVGQRLLEGAAQKVVSSLFTCIKKQLEG
jgi:carbon monoxide dehydrogenase subunit G